MNLHIHVMNKRNRKGFTLAEVLLTVGIIVILLAIGIPSIFRIQRNLRQEELDRKAETIYQAAQNRLAELNLSGCSSVYQEENADVNKLGSVPDDASDEDGITENDIYYITSSDLSGSGSCAGAVMNSDVVDDDLLNNHWVIEYNPENAIIYAVFYSESRADCASEYPSSRYDTQLRYKENRLSDGARVGYYGGGSGTAGTTVTDMQPSLTIVNEEKLQANVTCTVPVSVTDYPVFKIDLSDTNGHTYTVYYAYYACSSDYMSEIRAEAGTNEVINDADAMKKLGRTYSLNLNLDDLSSDATRFVNLYGKNSAHTVKLDAGTPLTVTVTAMCPGNYKVTQNLYDSKTTNSLFDDSTAVDQEELTICAGIRYGRHLQNLDADSGVCAAVTGAKQLSDINFGENDEASGTKNWYDTYAGAYYNGCLKDTSPVFKPILNSALLTYDGACAQEASGDVTEYRIADLRVETDVDAGLFGILGLSSTDTKTQVISNVILTGAQVNTTGEEADAGALAGKIQGNVEIDHCQVYLTTSDRNEKNNQDVWISGANAGGLAGCVSDGTVSVKNSSASTVVGAYTYEESTGTVTALASENAAGLIGTVQGGDVTIDDSYADSYVVGANASGLVGTSARNVALNFCYSAGFVTYSEAGAGLVLGSADLNSSYTIICRNYMTDDSSSDYYSTAKSGSVSGNVYYSVSTLLQDPDAAAPAIDADTQAIGAATITTLTEALGSDHFKTDTSDSAAYNLMGQSLTTYTYPELKNVIHYGDWNADFQVGALVYYEQYSDGAYGFYGANVNSTLKNTGDVTGDGYGFAYLKGSSMPSSVNARVTFKDGSSADYTINLNSAAAYPITAADGRQYVIYPLELSLVNTTKASEDFYLKLEVTPDGASEKQYYYFNPHFAKTVVLLTDENAQAPSIDKNSEVYIRTPRQLYLMSRYYNTYKKITAPATFVQERNIDYAVYQWSTFYDKSVSAVKEQEPIGRNDAEGVDETFTANYNGRCHWIRNISFVTESGDYVGMFGQNEGRISNVVLRASYEADSASNSYVSCKKTAAGSKGIYMGILAGYNGTDGVIANCAVAGYDIAGSGATIHAYKNSEYYIGGLTGSNEGTISSCSADIPDIRLATTYANVSLGAMTGINTGVITSAYALGHIEVVYSKGGHVSIGGFAGSNSGMIRSSYCATALTASGSTTETYGFCPTGGKVNSCYYLNNGTFSYIGTLYPFDYDKGAGTSATYSDLKKMGEENPALCSYDFNAAAPDEENYPFRAVVTDSAGKMVHYGDWLDDEIMGDCGIFYWEHEENGENNGYHFTYLGITDGKAVGASTLCEAHDDGGVITSYGYGFYELNDGSTTLSLSNAVSSGTTYNQTASRALQSQFSKDNAGSTSKYYFHAYTTRTAAEAGGGDYVCMTGTSANSTWTLKNTSTSASYTFTVCPFFANAMQYSGASVSVTDAAGNTTDYSQSLGGTGNAYEVRSYDQLQYINWDTDKNVNNWDYRDKDSSWSFNNTTKKYLIYIWAGGTAKTYHWVQSHDLEDETAGTKNRNHFAPLGQAGCGFEQCYNGQCYKIKNLYISSSAQFAGLFGSLGSAELTNIVLCADEGQGLIESTYSDAANGYEPSVGALVGQLWGSSDTVVKNCVASGYDVQFNGQKTKYRYITVGGLIGELYNGANISNCAAANHVKVLQSNTKFRKQIGGLIGSSFNAKVTNCYSGGTLYVEDGTYGLYGGLIGNADGNNGGSSNTPTTLTDGAGTSTISNCYTYCDVPKSNVGSTATGYYYIAGNLQGGTITNCYYLKGQSSSNDSSKVVGLTYMQMSDGTLLGYLKGSSGTGNVSTEYAGFHNVSTTEGSENAAVDGKYSFPVSSALNGKNYPFPAIIEQKDMVFSNASAPLYVYVHYGDWPITGPYFENGRDSMDIFADMNSTGTYASYATKVYRLYVNETAMSAPAVTDFTSSDETIARVVSVGTKTDDNDGNGAYYPITVEAVNTGTAEISLKNTQAVFDLEITANISLLAETDPDPLRLSADESGKVTLYAVTELNENGTIPEDAVHYETAAGTVWSIAGNDTFTSSKTSNKNVWKITRETMGEAEMEAVFAYDYHGTALTGTTYIPVLEPDIVGLSDGDSYNVALTGNTDRTGSAVTYADNAPDSGAGDLFLYLTKDESGSTWDDMRIESILVDGISAVGTKGTETTTYKTTGTDSYEIVMNNTASSDSNYRYLSGTISCITTSDLSGNRKNVPLTVVVSDANGTKYTLKITLSQVTTMKALTVTYKDQSGHSVSTAILSGSHALPTQSEIKSMFSSRGAAFTVPAHQTMTGWSREGDSSGKVYAAGASYSFTENVTFTASFEDVKYSVTLNANGGVFGTGTQDSVTLTQTSAGADVDISKYVNGTQKAVKTGYALTGWNTKANGNGTSVSGRTLVSGDEMEALNEAGTTVLYAQWEIVTTRVKLDANKDSIASQSFTIEYGGTKLNGTYTKPAAGGYAFKGWYTAKEGGSLVVDTGGSLVKGAENYTDSKGVWTRWNTDETVTLYGQWQKGFNLTLVSGKAYSETFTVTEETASVAAAPGKNGSKTLVGWYTSNDGKGTRVLNADGSIAEATLSGYTSGGKFALTEDKTLYARWSYESVRYELTGSISGGNEYLVVDTNTAGSGHALSLTVSGNSASAASTDVTVVSGTTPYVEGADSLPVWSCTNSSYLMFDAMYYLYSDGSSVSGNQSSKSSWTYSNSCFYTSIRSGGLFGRTTKYYLYYNSTSKKFAVSTTQNKVYFYKKTSATAYTFDHDAS